MTGFDIFKMYASGLAELALCALVIALGAMLPLHMILDLAGRSLEDAGAFYLVMTSTMLFALWPGQSFWTIQRATSTGQYHSVIGKPSTDDEAAVVRKRVRRLRD